MTVQQALQSADESYRSGQLDKAYSILRDVLATQPRQPEALHILGLIAYQRGQHSEAAAALRTAIVAGRPSADLYSDLGMVLAPTGSINEEIQAYRQALTIDPGHYSARNNLGAALRRLGEGEAAEIEFRRALAVRPRSPEAMNNLANVLREEGKLQEAIDTYQRALESNPNSPQVRYNIALTLLLQGRLEQAWELYEARLQMQPQVKPQQFAQPLWDGSPLAGRRILLHSEQGFGDTIQFIRYVPLVQERGGSVIVQCQPALKRLLESQRDIANVIAQHEVPVQLDFQCPLMSLARVFSTSLSSIPSRVPYLKADPVLIESWQKKLELLPKRLNVGLVWAGSRRHTFDLERSVLLQLLAPLGDLKNVRFVSLQKGYSGPMQLPAGMELLDWTESLHDFADTAALMHNLDLIVTVDTAVAHLAGALGKPAFVLLPYVPDWRWMLKRDDSPWYPTLRLFRQPARGDWQAPILQVAQELRQMVQMIPHERSTS